MENKAFKFGSPTFILLLFLFGLSNMNCSGNSSNQSSENNEAEVANDVKENVMKAKITPIDSIPKSIQDILDNMVDISGGTFTMGCTSEQKNCREDEKPTHSVTLSNFKMAKYEITEIQWRTIMGNNFHEVRFSGCDNCPVVKASWNDIQEFIERLNNLTGDKFRLPTEAEWEYAARGGNKSKQYQYAGSNTLDEVTWYWRNSNHRTHPVGRKKPNELDLHDMMGNVSEWCSDWYGENYYSVGTSNDPKGASSGEYKVIRGCSFGSYEKHFRFAVRHFLVPAYNDSHTGFRLAQTP